MLCAFLLYNFFMKKLIAFLTLLLLSSLFILPGSSAASFYKAKPAQLKGKKGKLIRSKAAPKTVRLAAASRNRTVLYTTRTVSGKRVAASGTVMLPKGKAPRGGWPVILFHHGTTGMADVCAPSRGNPLIKSYSDISSLYRSWLAAGYALVLPDYEGLGTPGPHPYLIGKSQARSSLDMLPAAKKLFPALSRKYSIIGHSQGGQAAIFSASIAKGYMKGFQNVGTISYAPASGLDLQAKLLAALGSEPSSLTALATLIVRSAAKEARTNPAPVLNPRIFSKKDSVLSRKGFSLWQDVDKVCLPQMGARTAASGGLAPSAFLTASDWTSNPTLIKIEKVLKAMDPTLKVSGNLAILQGTADTTVLPDLTNTLVSRLEGLNPARVDYEIYPGATHSSILETSAADVLLRLSGWFK
jgi:pimeloyl-ACP methyl ester carboxylesterase